MSIYEGCVYCPENERNRSVVGTFLDEKVQCTQNRVMIIPLYIFFANGSMKVCYSFERQILLSTLMIGNKLEKKTRKILLAKKYVLIDVEPISSSADEGRPKRKSIWIRPNQQLFAL